MQNSTLERHQLRRQIILNERVLPFYEEHELPGVNILTDRGTEYCGKPEHHDYQLYLALSETEYTRTKARHPQTNGIVERFHKTILNGCFPFFHSS